MPILKTYLQISDIHFCGLSLQKKYFDPTAKNIPFIDGCVGHNHATLSYLKRAFKQLKKTDPNVELVITGDLTSCGATESFDLAINYLSTKGKHPSYLGLDCINWQERAVPGNHDHWPGIPCWPLGTTNPDVQKTFPRNWFITDPIQLTDGFSVMFIGLDSDSDVGEWSKERFFACGSFHSAINELDTELNNFQPQNKEIRVLMLHHSVTYRGKRIGINFRGVQAQIQPMTIDAQSLQALERIITKHKIKVVLTGHVHLPIFIGRTGFGNAMEARCGTTCQSLKRSKRQNSVIIHRIVQKDNGETYWQSEAHAFSFRTGKLQPLPPYRGNEVVWP